MNELDRFTLIRLNRMTEKVLDAYESYEFHIVYQAVHHFCAVEMSAFYLDISKDRLYASAPDEAGRKAAQTVLYEALTVITKLIAPILPHSTDEVWKYIPGQTDISVQLTDMPQPNKSLYEEVLENKWDRFITLREDVFKALEEARNQKTIGNSLGAAVHLYPNAETFELLAQFPDLDQLFIVSQVALHPAGAQAPAEALTFAKLSVLVTVADGEKCERCWIVTTEVGQSADHPTLCKRCASVVVKLV